MPGLPVLYYLPELAQTHVHRVSDAIQPSHLLSSPSPAFTLSLHDALPILLKSRDITLLTNFSVAKAMVFLVVMHECESWTIKKAECRRIDTFELWC